MRILMVTPYVPLATKPRPHRLLRYLAQHHELHLIAFDIAPDSGYRQRPDFAELRRACASVTMLTLPRPERYRNAALSVFTPLPARAAYYGRRLLTGEVLRLVESKGIDVIHVDQLRLAHLCATVPLPKVVDSADCVSEYLWQCARYVPAPLKAAYAFEAAKTVRFERAAAAGYDRCLVTTQRERSLFSPTSYFDRVEVVPNLLDRELFDRPLRSGGSASSPTVVFLGNLSYLPNVDAARLLLKHIWPRVRTELPEARLVFAGASPSSSLLRAARAAGAEVTGFVPDLNDLIQSATMVVSPVRIAAGFPNKVAEALALGKPVVSSSVGCRGLEGSESVLEVADDHRAFAEAVVRLARDESARSRLARAAREYAQAYLHPDHAEAQVDRVFADVARQSLVSSSVGDR